MPMNMAYCRFENTLAALRECAEALDYGSGPRGEREEAAAKELLLLCRSLADSYQKGG